MPYPTGEDLAAWMVAQRLLAQVPEDLAALEIAAEAASAGWEADTGWSPFLAETETRRLDGPEGYVLYLDGGLLSVSSLKIDGVPYAEGEAFFLQHRQGRGPWRAIEFGFPVRGVRRAVEVAGTWGYAATLPADVKLALLSKAAAGISTDSTSTGALKREKAGPVEYEYDVSAGATTKASQLEASYATAVARYRRWA